MPRDLEKKLTNVGFLPSEAKTYLASLQLGPATVQKIAEAASISRTAAYEAIELLKNRGLMSMSTLGKRRVFSVEDPDRIVSHLKEEQQRFKTKLQDIVTAVTQMQLLAGGHKPIVKVYEGDEALHAYFEHVADVRPKAFDEISNLDDVYEHLDQKNLLSARKAYKWTNKKGRLLHRGELRNPRKGVEFKELGKEWGEFHGNIALYGKYVALVSYVGKTTVVIIESENLANTMRLMYEMAWKSA